MKIDKKFIDKCFHNFTEDKEEFYYKVSLVKNIVKGKVYALIVASPEQGTIINERFYKMIDYVGKLNDVDIESVVVKQVGGEDTTVFSLTKADCKELGIPYEPKLQLFPLQMKWRIPYKKVMKMHKLVSEMKIDKDKKE